MKLVLIEGIPGTGKSCTADQLCQLLKAAGRPACWHLEESANHPVHPASLKQSRHTEQFIANCLEHWRRFVVRITSGKEIFVLEGSAFQSTVRFMIENQWKGIAAYFADFQCIVQELHPRFIYLRPTDLQKHCDYTIATRGEAWASKVAGYLESSPFSQSQGFKGISGMNAFWQHYAQECDALVSQLNMPLLTVPVEGGNWDEGLPKIRRFLSI